MTPSELSAWVKEAAAQAGFDRCGVAALGPIGHSDYVRWWLARGMAGSMEYLHRHLDKRLDPSLLLQSAKSAIVVALSYKQPSFPSPREEGCGGRAGHSDRAHSERSKTSAEPRGRIAMYAWGEDYHDVLRDKLGELERTLRQRISAPFQTKVCVDTAPVIERELAASAGIGWIARNTLVIDPQLGSYFFLGVLLTTLDLAPDEPMLDHCGTCTACLEACPTQAFISPYQMDASRCISYLTIEHRGAISKPFQEMMGDWVFGCDICQEVCPHNRKAPDTREPRFAARELASGASLLELLTWTENEYRENTHARALSRAKLTMLKRNAAIAAKNQHYKNGLDAVPYSSLSTGAESTMRTPR